MEHLLPWFRLKHVPGIGNHLFKRLIDHFETPESVFTASLQELARIEGISSRLAEKIHGYSLSDAIEKDMDRVLRKNINIVTMTNSSYPALLLQLPDPPPFLYVKGKLDGGTGNIAVVGSRNATRYGLSMARQLSKELTKQKLRIVSGMARGIDTEAHQGALAGGGRTFAVLGSGLDNIYPPENARLADRIADNGAVISEFPMTAEPDGRNFPIRNRIICGMSLGTVVVEATKKSGSLITANLAADQGREVFAVPGSVRSFKSTGTHSLLKQGAKLVEQAGDVIDELAHLLPETSTPDRPVDSIEDSPQIDGAENLVYQALEPYPVHFDIIKRKTNLDSGELAGILLKLELKGLVYQDPGKNFCICKE